MEKSTGHPKRIGVLKVLVIIKLKGAYIGETIMDIEEIKRAEASGFTIIQR